MIIRSFGASLRSVWSGLSARVGQRSNISGGVEAESDDRVRINAEMRPLVDVVWPVEPMGHRDDRAVQHKLDLLDAPHVKPLNDWVRALNRERSDSLTSVENVAPWFDPSSGGVLAKTLILLEAPGPRATSSRGSGFISIDNVDQTARNMFMLTAQGGLSREDFVPWNIVPWYLPEGRKTMATRRQDVLDAVPYVESLLELFVDLERVITLGDHSRKGWEIVRRQVPGAVDLLWDAAPHPSATNLNTRPESRQLLLECFERAARLFS